MSRPARLALIKSLRTALPGTGLVEIHDLADQVIAGLASRNYSVQRPIAMLNAGENEEIRVSNAGSTQFVVRGPASAHVSRATP